METKVNLKKALTVLKDYSISSDEMFFLTQYFISKIGKSLSKEETKCLELLLMYCNGIPSLYAEHLENKRKIIEVEKILKSEGKADLRMRTALEVFGVGIKRSKEYNYRMMKSLYDIHNKQSKFFHKKGVRIYQISHNDIQHTFNWKTDRERKLGIIDALVKCFKAKSRNAIIGKLTELETQDLPGQEGSGMYRYR